MEESELIGQLAEVGLPKASYWDARYFKDARLLSRPQYRMRVERDVAVPMRDGVVLRADVFRPDAPGEFPGLLALSAYGKDSQSVPIPAQPIHSWVFDHNVEAGDIEFFVQRGYAYVIPDERGLGKSEGVWNGPFSVQEQQDGHDIVEWIAAQPWCSGKVGMMGISWFGMIQRFVAAQAPPHLAAIFPYEAANDLYGVAYEGGVIQPFWWELEREIPAHTTRSESDTLYSPEELAARVRRVAENRDIALNSNYVRLLARRNTAFFDQLLHPENDAFWARRRSRDKVGNIEVPVYTASCWIPFFKPFMDAVWDDLNDPALAVPKKAAIFGHHIHTQLPGPPELKYEALRWYDHWLKGVDTGIMDEPPIRLFVMGANRYRYEHEWPLARTQWTKLYLRPFGALAPLPEPTGADPDPLVHRPPIISTERSSVRYNTPPMSAPTEVTGPVALHLYAALDQPDGTFVAKLWAVGPGGERFPLCRGVLRASHRALDEARSTEWNPVHPHVNPQPVTPGEVNPYAIAFPAISYLFRPGERLELEISTCDPIDIPWHHRLNVMGPLPSMTLTYYRLYRDRDHPSYLLLPVIPPS